MIIMVFFSNIVRNYLMEEIISYIIIIIII